MPRPRRSIKTLTRTDFLIQFLWKPPSRSDQVPEDPEERKAKDRGDEGQGQGLVDKMKEAEKTELGGHDPQRRGDREGLEAEDERAGIGDRQGLVDHRQSARRGHPGPLRRAGRRAPGAPPGRRPRRAPPAGAEASDRCSPAAGAWGQAACSRRGRARPLEPRADVPRLLDRLVDFPSELAEPTLQKALTTMDQLKEFLRQCIKYRFWISVGVAALFAIIAYFVGSGPVQAKAEKETRPSSRPPTRTSSSTPPGTSPTTSTSRSSMRRPAVLTKDVNTAWKSSTSARPPC